MILSGSSHASQGHHFYLPPPQNLLPFGARRLDRLSHASHTRSSLPHLLTPRQQHHLLEDNLLNNPKAIESEFYFSGSDQVSFSGLDLSTKSNPFVCLKQQKHYTTYPLQIFICKLCIPTIFQAQLIKKDRLSNNFCILMTI